MPTSENKANSAEAECYALAHLHDVRMTSKPLNRDGESE
jgi:hypothetical protein